MNNKKSEKTQIITTRNEKGNISKIYKEQKYLSKAKVKSDFQMYKN